ncbi:MAG: NUDIX hydrolase [Elusimicrobiota bacterium]
MKAEKPGPRSQKEVSAGGVVRRGGELLLVKVKNLKGDIVWTFPKGHLEEGETPEQAALREVMEETGWRCETERPYLKVRYFFQREGRLVHKTVHWFLMRPLGLEGACDPDEILECRWTPQREAEALLSYDSDRKIMAGLKREDRNAGAR